LCQFRFISSGRGGPADVGDLKTVRRVFHDHHLKNIARLRDGNTGEVQGALAEKRARMFTRQRFYKAEPTAGRRVEP
jgi:hypothetical protein